MDETLDHLVILLKTQAREQLAGKNNKAI